MTLDQRLLIALTRQEPERCFLERRLCERSKLSCRFAASPNDYLVEQQFHNPKERESIVKTKHENIGLPKIVERAEWLKARQELLVKEKQLTHALDALAAERRRLPMVRFSKDYVFEGPTGKASLLDLFDERRQLVVYHFMWLGAPKYCPGCSSFVDNIGHLAHLHARDTSLVLVSDGPLAEIAPYKKRMGWTVPWFSAQGSDFNSACRVIGGSFGLSIFLHAGDSVFQTYFTTARGVDRLRFDFNLLDLTPLGRQETWEDSPDGWPQTAPYQWWRLHDEYEGDSGPNHS